MTIWQDEERPQPKPYDDLWRSRQWHEVKALERPATELEIAQCLALLLKAYPNASTADGEVFGATLLEDVVAAQPSIGDIQEACKCIRRTSRFVPSIAEVIETLAEAKSCCRTITASVGTLVDTPRKVDQQQHRPKYLEHRPTLAQLPIVIDDPLAIPL